MSGLCESISEGRGEVRSDISLVLGLITSCGEEKSKKEGFLRTLFYFNVKPGV